MKKGMEILNKNIENLEEYLRKYLETCAIENTKLKKSYSIL